MKHIRKNPTPPDITAGDYGSLPATLRREIKQSLLNEQGYLCCYCQRRIKCDESHIEHFRPQCACPHLSASYANMLCSCNSDDCCARRKGGADDSRLINPTDEHCEGLFLFIKETGEIKPTGENLEASRFTIETLGLNKITLKNARRATIKGYERALCSYDEEVRAKQIADFLQKTDGKYKEYDSFVRQILT